MSLGSRYATCLALVAASLLGCQTGGGAGDDDDDSPPVPLAEDDAAEALAAQICEQLFACSCANSVLYADEAECVEVESANIAASIDPLLEAGGTWNAECAGQMLKTFDRWDCRGPTLAFKEASYNAQICPVIKGTLGEGSDCWRTSIGDDCQPGLTCVTGICVQLETLPVPAGGLCEYEWETLPCVAGTYCTYDENSNFSTCQPLPQAGDSCTVNEYLCGPAANDLICDVGTATCIPAPGAGEPCFDGFLCGPGNYCDGGLDFTCQPRKELGDGCGADTVCPVDASCNNNICEADPPAVCSALNVF